MDLIESFTVMHIREYFPSIESPSSSSWVFNQALGLNKIGINSIVVSPTPWVPNFFDGFIKMKHTWKTKPSRQVHNYLGVDVIRPPFLKVPSKLFFKCNLKQLEIVTYNALKCQEKFEILHAHFGHAGVFSLKSKLRLKRPLITSFYGFDLGSDKELLRNYYKQLADKGDLFIALSDDMANDLVNIGFPSNRIKVQHLGIDVNVFQPNNGNLSKGDKFVFLIVASFTKRKGIHFAIDAFKKFTDKTKDHNSVLKIIGDGPFASQLQVLSEGREDIIFINNFIAENPRQLVRSEMQNCDVFMLTSITLENADKEGTPVVLMEAQGCGKPCIATRHAGIPEIVIDDYTGYLVPERSVESIVNSMMILHSDSDKRRIFGENARNHILLKFNNEWQIPLLGEIYKKYLV